MHRTDRAALRLAPLLGALLTLLALLAGISAPPAHAFGQRNGWMLLSVTADTWYRVAAERPGGGYILAGELRNIPTLLALDADGRLDPTFGDGGFASIDYGKLTRLNALAVAPDGRLLIAGSVDNDFFVARFTAAGRPDPTFGTNGKSAPVNFQTSTFFGQRSHEAGYDLIIQPDGKIVVAGRGGDCGLSSCYGTGFGLIRLLANGQLDQSFGNKGKRLTTFSPGSGDGSSTGTATALLRLRDGRLLAVGSAWVDRETRLAVVRYTAAGDLDTSFHFDGKESYPGLGGAVSAAELPDGRVLVGTSRGEVVRILPDGRLDPTFGTNGRATLNGFTADRMALQPDGRILLIGELSQPAAPTRKYVAVFRLTGAGQIDASFGGGRGFVVHQPISVLGHRLVASTVSSSLLQSDGRMLILSYHHEIAQSNDLYLTHYLLRLRPDGAADLAGSPPPSGSTGFAANDSYATVQGQRRTVAAPGVLANDRAPSGRPLSARLVTPPANGDVTLLANGAFTYTPRAGFVGTDRFSYQASDGQGATAIAVAEIKVNPIGGNGAPLASSVGYDLLAETPLSVPSPGVLTNDSDPEGDELRVELVGLPANGRVELNSEGGYLYTPDPGFVGTDYFYYRAGDGLEWSEPTTVTLRVHASGTNVAPIAVGDRFLMAQGTTLEVPAPGVLANDQDHNGDAVTVALVDGGGPSHGSVELWPDGSFVYTPDAGFLGEDVFSYALSDGEHTKQATVRIYVVEEVVESPPDDDPTEEVERPGQAPVWSAYLPQLVR